MLRKTVDRVSPLTGSRSQVFVDTSTGKRKIVNSVNIKEQLRFLKEKRANIGDKRTKFYDSKLKKGHRFAAAIDPLIWVNHPEIWEDDQEMKKFLDKHEELKYMNVGYTYVKNKRAGIYSASVGERIDKIFSGK